MSTSFRYGFPTCVFETGFLTELRTQLDWDPPFFLIVLCSPPVSPLPPFFLTPQYPDTDTYKHTHRHTDTHTFYKGIENVNSGPHVHAAGTTPLSPQPCVVNLKFGRHTLKRLSIVPVALLVPGQLPDLSSSPAWPYCGSTLACRSSARFSPSYLLGSHAGLSLFISQ